MGKIATFKQLACQASRRLIRFLGYTYFIHIFLFILEKDVPNDIYA